MRKFFKRRYYRFLLWVLRGEIRDGQSYYDHLGALRVFMEPGEGRDKITREMEELQRGIQDALFDYDRTYLRLRDLDTQYGCGRCGNWYGTREKATKCFDSH